MDQENRSNRQQHRPTTQPQHLATSSKIVAPSSLSRSTLASNYNKGIRMSESTLNTTTRRMGQPGTAAAPDAATYLDIKPPASVTRHHGTLTRDTGQQQQQHSKSAPQQPQRMPLTADQFSSSLATIASASARQALHHQQSSSSSDSSREARVVNTVTATEGTSASNSGSNTNSSGSGSGEDNRESGGDVRTPQPPQATHSHHHTHAHTSRRNKRGDDYGLPLRVDDDRLQHAASNNNSIKAPTNHHATVVARLPPPDSQSSSLSSSGNEGSSGPAYHTIKQTLQSTLKQSSSHKKKKSKMPSLPSVAKKLPVQPRQQETMSSDSSGNSLKRHHHHHHGSKRPASGDNIIGVDSSMSSSNKKKKLKSSKNSSSAITGAPSMARKRRSHQLDSGTDSPLKMKAPPRRTATEAEDDNYGSNSSSGSGTEAGYAGSASSNENKGEGESNGSSTSNSSSDIPDFSSGASESNAYAFATSPSNSPSLSSSNGDDEEDDSSEDDGARKQTKTGVSATSTRKDGQWPPHFMKMKIGQDRKLPAVTTNHSNHKPTRNLKAAPGTSLMATAQSQFAKISRGTTATTTSTAVVTTKPKTRRPVYATTSSSAISKDGSTKPPILTLGSDLMAHVLTFLEPPDILRVLTMPLSRDWQATFANQQELWRVLCLLEPFKAQVEEDDFSSSSSSSSSSCDEDDEDADDDGSLSSFSVANGNAPPAAVWKKRPSSALKPVKSAKLPKLGKLGKYRLLYTSFVRCMKYLARMKEDVLHGRPPSIEDYGGLQASAMIASPRDTIGSNRSLQQFLAGARGVVESQQQEQAAAAAPQEEEPPPAAAQAANMPIMSADDGSSSYHSSVERRRKRKKTREQKRRSKKPKFGRSMLTDRLLGPAPSGEVNPENVALPWSCALYSIVNWMVAFADVEGIQVMCLKVLPYLLEDEQQRITAQRVGLTDVILRGMILFPDNVQLHTASFHTLVLLARPLGGREGMLFHSSMVNAAGIFSGGEARNGNSTADGDDEEDGTTFSGGPQSDGKNGIAVMLDSMRRFEADEALQAMSCWSLVNIALAPVQKEVLVKLGGIGVTTNAMMRHPHNAEVQFRALFALINLVIPSVNVTEGNGENQESADGVNEGIAEELDEAVGQITNLVVLAMKNFCSSEAILNRACLVLHNLSLTQAYHSTLLWTPNCYQMLEWCLANYRTDQVLQQSAAGTLHRLQVTLSNDENLRSRFAASIQAQQQLSLEAAHREALHIYEQQEQLRQGREAARGGAE